VTPQQRLNRIADALRSPTRRRTDLDEWRESGDPGYQKFEECVKLILERFEAIGKVPPMPHDPHFFEEIWSDPVVRALIEEMADHLPLEAR
jgi:hypothetical protein